MNTNTIILENEEIKHKKELLKNAEKVLKEELIGIDNVIDDTLLNIRPWYLYPELQDRPLVITLVGLTGTGKTQIVRRLAELLDITGDMVYFNFAEIGEMKSWEIEDTFEESIDNGTPNKMFVYDEFQYAATIDENGGEKDNKTGLKPFWELMDSGVLHRRISTYEIHCLRKLLDYAYRINKNCRINLENGRWVNAEECLSSFSAYDRDKFEQVFNVPRKKRDDEPENTDNTKQYQATPVYNEDLNVLSYDDGDADIFIRNGYINKLSDMYARVYKSIDNIDFHNMLCKFDFLELCAFIEDLIKKGGKGYDMNFSKSVIFVLMNLDEAYEMSFNVNPDMLPDQFHKITKKLTIVDIKEALRKRFRNEQIGRLGNLFMIYPSFSEKSFREIINLLLAKYSATVKDKWQIDLEFDDSVKEIIYKDSVFPTHGTRPIISSVHEIIKTKLPLVVDSLGENNVESVDKMVYSFDGTSIKVVSYLNDKVIGEVKIKQSLRVDNHRKLEDKEQQALIAAHESGHFVMYAKLHGKLPEKVCSATIQKDTGGFMLRDNDDADRIYSKEDCLNDIKVTLGGYVAEKMIFGDIKRTSGASDDLKKATVMASAMVRSYGLGNRPEVTTYMTGEHGTSDGMLINDDSKSPVNAEIRNIITACMTEVENTFNQVHWKKMLKDSAIYLSEHTNMNKEKMEELYNEVPENIRLVIDNNFYRNAIQNF